MQTDDVKVAVGQYLDLVVNGRGDEHENVRALLLLLDMLAWMQHLNEEPASNGVAPGAEPPEREFDKMRTLIGEQYPSFSAFDLPADPRQPNDETKQHHPVEDLADIACELFEVAWRFQNTSDDDALRAFADGYEQRWCLPLRRVQWYLSTSSDPG